MRAALRAVWVAPSMRFLARVSQRALAALRARSRLKVVAFLMGPEFRRGGQVVSSDSTGMPSWWTGHAHTTMAVEVSSPFTQRVMLT